MSVSLEEFTKRAQDADNKLRSLEAQINALASTTLSHKTVSKDTDDEKSSWEIFYWPLKNRGNFIKLVFEEANIPYKDMTVKEMKTQIRSNLAGSLKYDEGGLYQAMAPPLIKNGDFTLSQSIVCMGYLSEKYGICPCKYEDKARAQMIANDCNDLMGELYGYKDKPKEELFKFIDGRFDLWLELLEKPLKKNNLKFYFDEKCTQADLAMFNIMDGIEELFGKKSFDKYVASKHEYLVNVYNGLKERESIKRLMKKQDGMYTFAPNFGWGNVRKYFRE
eukprot:216395_1